MKRALAWIIAAAAAAANASAQAWSDGESVAVVSPNGYDFAAMATSDPIEITGTYAGADGTLKGVAILSHGSGGGGSRQRAWAAFLREEGWATLTLDHFRARGATSTVREQLAVSEQQMAADVIAAAKAARAAHGDPQLRVAHFGWSKGATAGLLAAVDRFSAYMGAERPALDAIIAFYPFCGVSLEGESSATRLRILHGTDDDWTPIGPCREAVEALRETGADAEIFEIQGGLHGFDAWGAPRRQIARAITVRDTSERCRLRVGPDGVTRNGDETLRVDSILTRTAYLAVCGERGVSVGGSPNARADTIAAVREALAF